jgi:hypothetical protein
MPYVKFIAGHTGTGAIRGYLQRNGRALAVDYLNLDAPVLRGSLGELPEYGDFDWSAAMDGTRRDFGTDSSWGGKRARTFKHYIFSPNPSDDLDIQSLRRLATAWAERCFPDHEVAIVYHDDNAAHVLHAHVVVNNVNLATGKRLQEGNPRALKKTAQELAREMGLSFFGDEPESSPSGGKSGKRYRPRTKQRVYKRKAEAEIEAKGGYSWVGDIRGRVAIAKGVATSQQEFESILRSMGVVVSDNSPKARRRDWLYSLADHPTRRVSGEKMGLSFGKQAIQESFAQGQAGRLSNKTAREIAKIAESATEVGDLEELHDLSNLVEACSKTGSRSIDELIGALGSAKAKGESQRSEELERAIKYAFESRVLPEKAAPSRAPDRKLAQHPGERKPWDEKPWRTENSQEKSRSIQQHIQRQREQERRKRDGR